jgi:MGT family glycosyltransferase
LRILLISTPLTGHLNPLLAIGKMLMAEGHEIACLSASAMRGRIESAGARFLPFPAGADLDLGNRDELFPEWTSMAPGPERRRFILERAYVDTIPAQHEGLQRALQSFPADIVIGDNMMFGLLPMLLGRRAARPPIVVCSAISSALRRDDGAPTFAGLPPATSESERQRYAALLEADHASVMGPLAGRLERCLEKIGVEPPATDMFEALVVLPDAFLQMTVPAFEFPCRELPSSIHFVGTLPVVSSNAELPAWAHELDGTRKIVLVTQGTLANYSFDLLITPTLTALADDEDVLVLVTTGGRPIESIPGPIPANARLASFVPYDWLLPKVDLLVTNGGYGSVNQALSLGIPLVTAGLTEDKADVNARVAWSGVGIDLATNAPTAEGLRHAIKTVLREPAYRARARAMAEAFARIDTRAEILGILARVRTGRSASGVS